MRPVWVDTDFGFDDLWAVLLLRHLACDVAGVSLVAGNAPLAQVAANAEAARAAYGFSWPVYRGAERPLRRSPETAERILGPTGMRSRGAVLPEAAGDVPVGGIDALGEWLAADTDGSREVLALGPLTNIAELLTRSPQAASRISRLVWMGGSAGAGNHTPYAEFNAIADPEALDHVARSGVRLEIVDLTFCRQIVFSETDMPRTDPLTRDLLGGYLDIALERGRPGMAIYDPLAALALAAPETVAFAPMSMAVCTEGGPRYGATTFTPSPGSAIGLATEARADLLRLCLGALTEEALHGP